VLLVGVRIGPRLCGPVQAAGQMVATRLAIGHDDARRSVVGRCVMVGATWAYSPSGYRDFSRHAVAVLLRDR